MERARTDAEGLPFRMPKTMETVGPCPNRLLIAPAGHWPPIASVYRLKFQSLRTHQNGSPQQACGHPFVLLPLLYRRMIASVFPCILAMLPINLELYRHTQISPHGKDAFNKAGLFRSCK